MRIADNQCGDVMTLPSIEGGQLQGVFFTSLLSLFHLGGADLPPSSLIKEKNTPFKQLYLGN